MEGIHQPKADVQNLYNKRKNGGRCPTENGSAFNFSLTICQAVKKYDLDKDKFSIQKEATKIKMKLKGIDNVKLQESIGEEYGMMKNQHIHKTYSR